MNVSLMVLFVTSCWMGGVPEFGKMLEVYSPGTPQEFFTFSTSPYATKEKFDKAIEGAKRIRVFDTVLLQGQNLSHPDYGGYEELVQAFAHHPRIRTLAIRGPLSMDRAAPFISSEVEFLEIHETGLTGEVLKAVSLPGESRLRVLKMEGVEERFPPVVFGEAGLESLPQLRELKVVYLVNCGVTDTVAEAFCTIPVTDLKLDRNPLKGAFFYLLPASLERLSLCDCRLRDEEIEAPLLSEKLQALDLSDNQIGDQSIAKITPRLKRSLRQLWLRRTDISDRSLEVLSQCEELRELDLSQCRITQFPQTGFSKLEVLDLSDTQIENEALDFVEHLPALKRLNLNGNRLLDAAIERLAKSKSLEIVSIARNKIDGEALAQRMPQASIWRSGETPWIMSRYGAVVYPGFLGQRIYSSGGFALDPQQTDIVRQEKRTP